MKVLEIIRDYRNKLNEMKINPHDREEGTDSLDNTYRGDTPGQSKTLRTIKKAIKK